jgi:large subunit ribosomal protein L5
LSTQKTKSTRMRELYRATAIPALQKRFGFKNVMEVPRLDKIVLNMGVGKATQEPKLLDEAVAQMRAITGQSPLVTRAKKAISNFKLRENIPIGCKVTLRGNRMYEFFDRLVAVAIPRILDFRGLSKKCVDGRGNYTFGIKEQVVFLEIDRDKVTRVSGLDVTICTTARNDEYCIALLEAMGMPFRK